MGGAVVHGEEGCWSDSLPRRFTPGSKDQSAETTSDMGEINLTDSCSEAIQMLNITKNQIFSQLLRKTHKDPTACRVYSSLLPIKISAITPSSDVLSCMFAVIVLPAMSVFRASTIKRIEEQAAIGEINEVEGEGTTSNPLPKAGFSAS
ncbi:hypothetical protein KIN20_013638 [Parelaphostrongylus tenuis]|uniref:Uncharacterized protein n=1 Tax=Parelaphostrongylus tenuis TaxID=148309 RepID=A0AAD5MCF2_PARTN|nr:hypothetical protein KIN20_013638 [Parelaphostrongylus tenuis]